MNHYHVGLPPIHVDTAVNAPPEIIFGLALPSEHCNSYGDRDKSAHFPLRYLTSIIPLSKIHVRTEGKRNNSEEGKLKSKSQIGLSVQKLL